VARERAGWATMRRPGPSSASNTLTLSCGAAGGEAAGSAPATQAAVPAPTPAPAPAPVTTAAPAAAAPSAHPSGAPLVVGDAVVLGSTAALQAALGSATTVDGKSRDVPAVDEHVPHVELLEGSLG